jgi:putative methionine-R-sulfoxide reductase with GAF domain
MELSIIRLQDPAPVSSAGERRRRIRHQLHTPVYASFKGPSTGMVLDLSELLDLSEDGFAVQTSERLEVNRPVSLSLDLLETKTHIYGTGEVVWSDGTGRAGIRFSGLPDSSRSLLKEWLFVNLLIASSNYAARAGHVSEHVEKRSSPPRPSLRPVVLNPVADFSGMLSAVEAVRGEVRAAGDDFDVVLHLITERALSLTGAGGAALAFLTDDKMICRARAGEPALPLGIAVDLKQGLSGECVRNGRMVACEDTEYDPRVDREICRTLGIGSILAAPIFSDFRVVGLIEVFSPRPRAFTEIHETALDRLVEVVPKAQAASLPSQDAAANLATPLTAESTPTMNTVREAVWEPETEAREPLKGVPVQLLHILLLVLTLAALFLVAGYVSAPKIERLWLSKPVAGDRGMATVGARSTSVNASPQAKTPDDLRKLAEQGDAEAQWDMGFRYHNGQGVPQDDAQAVRWFQRAADQGHVNAQATLGAYYWAGRGVPKDLSQAYFWSAVALHQGDRDSESRLRGLALQMTRGQVAAAQQQVDDWLRQHRAAK